MKMSEADFANLREHSNRLEDLRARLNECILSPMSNDLVIDMRELMIECRNFMRYEREDVDAFIQHAETEKQKLENTIT